MKNVEDEEMRISGSKATGIEMQPLVEGGAAIGSTSSIADSQYLNSSVLTAEFD